MNRGEIWWVDFDPAIGSEIRKTRPAVIISDTVANPYLARVTVVPMTSNIARPYPSEALVTVADRRAKAMANQIATVDKSRLRNRIGKLSKSDMWAVEDIVRIHLAL